ncbi:MAG: Gfo/Idh/MocA family oxidoreductase [Clostridia bacterium]|nr:Gfo/Idh/MocA family oxidoreductase [Clostridia bacterium]
MSEKKVRIGIIGCGNMGSAHFNNILAGKCPEIEVTAIADLNPARLDWAKKAAEQAREKYPERAGEIKTPEMFSDASAMIKSGLVDAVIVSVPHYSHPKYVIEALENGVHPMCEKPAGVYTLQVREMMRVADEHPELKFGMMFNQRTTPVYRKMREIIKSGELGAIRRTSWIVTGWYRPQAYYNSGAWRATWSGEGGGVLLNQCPHNLDLWQWITGMPVKIDAKLHYGKWHDIEVEDDVTAYVEYENGATGTFITSTGDAPGDNRFEIVCDGGTLICDGGKLIKIKLEMPEPEFSRTNTVPFAQPKIASNEVVECTGANDQHVGVLNAFAGAILRGEPLLADGREGIRGLTISNAMHLSSWLGRPVDIPFDEELFKEELMKRVKTSRRKENIESVIADTSGTYNA